MRLFCCIINNPSDKLSIKCTELAQMSLTGTEYLTDFYLDLPILQRRVYSVFMCFVRGRHL